MKTSIGKKKKSTCLQDELKVIVANQETNVN